MKHALLMSSLLMLAGLVMAQDQNVSEPDRLTQFRRDFALIEALVREGINMAREDAPLERVQSCKTITEKLVQEIQKADNALEGGRSADLRHYLHTVLVRGIAPNLQTARREPRENKQAELRRLSDEILHLTAQIQKDDYRPEVRSMQAALEAVARGRAAVREALQEDSQSQP
jgi:hypothetical protein